MNNISEAENPSIKLDRGMTRDEISILLTAPMGGEGFVPYFTGKKLTFSPVETI